MGREIPFNKVMKDPSSWDDDMDLDIMTENYLKLKPVMSKMFFQEYPKHPQYFTLLFSQPDFADKLLKALFSSGISGLNRIYFKEFSEEERNVLIEMGMIELIPATFGLTPVVYAHHGKDFFVNLVL
jgi:hypothetical protein